MANGNVTATTAAVDIDEAWTPELQRAVELDRVIFDLFADWSGKLPHGDVLHRPDSHHLTANDKSASTDATPETITEGEQTFTVSTHKIVAQEIESFPEVQSKYDLRAEYTYHAAYALSRVQDVDAGNLLDDNTTQTVGTLGAELSYDNLLSARKYIRDSGGRMNGAKVVVAPGTYNGFLKIDQFVNAMYNGDTNGMAVREAQVGKLFGSAPVYESQLLPGTAPSASGHLWVGEHFFKIVQKQPTTDTWFSPLAKAWVVASDTIYGVFENQEANEGAALTTRARLRGVRLQSYK